MPGARTFLRSICSTSPGFDSGQRQQGRPDLRFRVEVEGVVSKIVFSNEENGWCVLKVQGEGQKDLITVVGHSPTVVPGEYLVAVGNWVNDRNFGRQLQASELRNFRPTTEEGMMRYLGSGLIEGIGTQYAKRLVKHFGNTIFEVITNSPTRLQEVKGIGPSRQQRITKSWTQQEETREIMIFLHSQEISPTHARRIHKKFGSEAVQEVKKNPYRLASEIRGIGFQTADKIASQLGFARTHELRLRAGVLFAVQERVAQGHCGVPYQELVEGGAALLEVDCRSVEGALQAVLSEGGLVASRVDGKNCIFLHSLYEWAPRPRPRNMSAASN
eukprot:gene8887-10531_t